MNCPVCCGSGAMLDALSSGLDCPACAGTGRRPDARPDNEVAPGLVVSDLVPSHTVIRLELPWLQREEVVWAVHPDFWHCLTDAEQTEVRRHLVAKRSTAELESWMRRHS